MRHQPGVYVPLRALFLIFILFTDKNMKSDVKPRYRVSCREKTEQEENIWKSSKSVAGMSYVYIDKENLYT